MRIKSENIKCKKQFRSVSIQWSICLDKSTVCYHFISGLAPLQHLVTSKCLSCYYCCSHNTFHWSLSSFCSRGIHECSELSYALIADLINYDSMHFGGQSRAFNQYWLFESSTMMWFLWQICTQAPFGALWSKRNVMLSSLITSCWLLVAVCWCNLKETSSALAHLRPDCNIAVLLNHT